MHVELSRFMSYFPGQACPPHSPSLTHVMYKMPMKASLCNHAVGIGRRGECVWVCLAWLEVGAWKAQVAWAVKLAFILYCALKHGHAKVRPSEVSCGCPTDRFTPIDRCRQSLTGYGSHRAVMHVSCRPLQQQEASRNLAVKKTNCPLIQSPLKFFKHLPFPNIFCGSFSRWIKKKIQQIWGNFRPVCQVRWKNKTGKLFGVVC